MESLWKTLTNLILAVSGFVAGSALSDPVKIRSILNKLVGKLHSPSTPASRPEDDKDGKTLSPLGKLKEHLQREEGFRK